MRSARRAAPNGWETVMALRAPALKQVAGAAEKTHPPASGLSSGEQPRQLRHTRSPKVCALRTW
jgi:hypothetical protein